MLPCLVKEFANRRNQVFINIYLISFILILISQMFFLAKQTLSRIEFRTNMTTTLEALSDSFGSLCVVVIVFRVLKVHLMLVLQKSTKTLARRIVIRHLTCSNNFSSCEHKTIYCKIFHPAILFKFIILLCSIEKLPFLSYIVMRQNIYKILWR